MNGRPLGITIIAIILAVSGVFQVLVGLEALGITSFGLTEVADEAGVSGWAAVIVGIATIVAAGGLFTLQSWAWLLAVFVLGVRIVADVVVAFMIGLTSSAGLGLLVNAAISAVILWYFFRPNVQAAFGRG